jgi:FeS assembly protein IscX
MRIHKEISKKSIKTERMTFDLPIHWNDYEDIAIKLYERFGDDFGESQIYRIRFTDLHNWIIALPRFDDLPDRGGEKVLEAIQQAWIEECE